jgi:heme exporter protein D
MAGLSEFLDMGGYAVFVWPAYGIAAVIMIVLAMMSWRALVAERAVLEKLEAEHGSRRGKRDGIAEGSN